MNKRNYGSKIFTANTINDFDRKINKWLTKMGDKDLEIAPNLFAGEKLMMNIIVWPDEKPAENTEPGMMQVITFCEKKPEVFNRYINKWRSENKKIKIAQTLSAFNPVRGEMVMSIFYYPK